MAELPRTGEPVARDRPLEPVAAPEPASITVLMGVSGSGKTLIGRALAETAAARFIDGDHYHPPANVSRMRAGLPLRDEDRWGWLDAIAEEIAAVERHGGRARATAKSRCARALPFGGSDARQLEGADR